MMITASAFFGGIYRDELIMAWRSFGPNGRGKRQIGIGDHPNQETITGEGSVRREALTVDRSYSFVRHPASERRKCRNTR